MLDDRKADVLRAVVQRYIATAQPVGSKQVADEPDIDVSAATIRNEMSVLERAGYLTQPHTSAGRIPTEKGYRFFVDSEPTPNLGAVQSRKVTEFFDHTYGEIEELLRNTTALLSSLTHNAAVVVNEPSNETSVKSFQLIGLSQHVVLILIVLSDGVVVKRNIELGYPVEPTFLEQLSTFLAREIIGQRLGEIVMPHESSPVADAVGSMPADTSTVEMVTSIVAATVNLLNDESHRVFVDGASQIVGSFDAVGSLQKVLGILEQQLVVVSLVHDVLNRGLQVAIGTETGFAPLAECSIVVAPYTIDGQNAGSIGVLGPTRMNYPEAIAAVGMVANRLSQSLSEGSHE